MKKMKAISFFVITLCFCSCKDDYTLCNVSKNVNFTAGFYNRISGVDVAAPAPSLYRYQLNSTSPIYNAQVNSKALILPLNSQLDSARYLVTISPSLQSDTVTIVYTSQSVNLSLDCGNVFYNNITKFYSTAHTIDSVKITRAAVNTDAAENAKIYW